MVTSDFVSVYIGPNLTEILETVEFCKVHWYRDKYGSQVPWEPETSSPSKKTLTKYTH